MAEISADTKVETQERSLSERLGIPAWLPALALLFFAMPLWDLYGSWTEFDSMGQAIICGLAAGVFVWDRRDSFLRLPNRGHWFGVLCCVGAFALGVFCRLLGEARGVTNGLILLEGLSMIGIVMGLVLMAKGWRGAFLLWPVPVFMFLMLPMIYLNYLGVPGKLQSLAAKSSEVVLRLSGISTYRTGNVVHTPKLAANVVDACSGVRSLTAAIPFTIFISIYSVRRWGSRVFLFAACIPIAVGANIFRISLNCWLANKVSVKLAKGVFHEIEGTLVYVVCLGTISLVALALRKNEKRLEKVFSQLSHYEDDEAPPEEGDGGEPEQQKPRPEPRRLSRGLFYGVGALLAVGVLFQGVEAFSIWQARKQFAHGEGRFAMPEQTGSYWQWEPLEDKQDIWELKECDRMGFWLVRGRKGEQLEVLVFYWRPGKADARLNVGHVPDICFVANGMTLEESKDVPLSYEVAGHDVRMTLHARRFLTQMGQPVFVSYWSQVGLNQALEHELFDRRNVRGLVTAAIHYAKTRAGCLNAPQMYFRIRSLQSGRSQEQKLETHLEVARQLAPRIVSQVYGWNEPGAAETTDQVKQGSSKADE